MRSSTNDAQQFRETPFGLTPDAQYFYFNSVYREALATLADGFESRKGLIVVTGEPGTGKTTLLRQLVHSLDAKFETAYLFNTLVSFNDLLHLIITDLGLRSHDEDKFEMIGRLKNYLLEEDRKGHIVALLIDEAQDLSLQILNELRLLTDLETDQKKLLQIALIGQPELERKLVDPELCHLNQQVALRCQLTPLAANEVSSYIDSKLRAVAQRCEALFDRDAIKKIALYSNGIPRVINILCNNAFLISNAATKSKIDEKMIDEVAADLCLDQSGGAIGFVPQLTQQPPAENDNLDTAREKTTNPATLENSFLTDCDAVLHNHKNLRRLMVSALLIVIVSGLGGFIYSQKTHDMEYAKLSEPALQNNSSNLQSQLPMPVSQNPQRFSEGQDISIAARPTPTIVSLADQPRSRQGIEMSPVKSGDEKQTQNRQSTDNVRETDNFEVVGASFVRNHPSSDADIIATLEPGTRVIVARRNREYYWVRSLGAEPIRGYVHREDAFFERTR